MLQSVHGQDSSELLEVRWRLQLIINCVDNVTSKEKDELKARSKQKGWDSSLAQAYKVCINFFSLGLKKQKEPSFISLLTLDKLQQKD